MQRSEFSEVTKLKILARDKYRCVYCGDYAQEVDHVIPASDGSLNTTSNGVAACIRCNRVKNNRLTLGMLTKAIYHLLIMDENIDWMDKFYNITQIEIIPIKFKPPASVKIGRIKKHTNYTEPSVVIVDNRPTCIICGKRFNPKQPASKRSKSLICCSRGCRITVDNIKRYAPYIWKRINT